jgi:hypothetical protein
MNNRPSPLAIDRNWKTLYRVAIFETNRNVIPQRLLVAEEAVLARGRDLYRQSGNIHERKAVETALYCLRAYKNARLHAEAP